jgi:hypothetical protein
VGTSLKIPGTKRIVRESINAVHHTPRGKAIWINTDPPPSKDYDIWIKGDCQRIPELYEDYTRFMEEEKVLKGEEIKRKEEEKVRVVEERLEKQAREKQRKEENQRARERRKEQKELEQTERKQRELERKQRKAEREAEKARRQLERAIRPMTKKAKIEEKKWARPPTPPLSCDTDSTLSSPSLSDIEFASFVESTPTKSVLKTPSTARVIEYLPTPATTPQKRTHELQEQDSPLKTKKQKSMWMDREPANFPDQQQRSDSMSIRFLTDSE